MARFALLALLSVRAALGVSLPKRTSDVPFFDPAQGGGLWLDSGDGSLGEPLNVVISGLSSPEVLTDYGFLKFAMALGFAMECFDLHVGKFQTANLGDGNGNVNQIMELRENLPLGGTCGESLFGGKHLRMFRQDGPNHNTGALFLAVSEEEGVFKKHTITPDGYDVGRDDLVQSALNYPSYGNSSYTVRVDSLSGYLERGSKGINHGIAIDGVVQLLTVTVQ